MSKRFESLEHRAARGERRKFEAVLVKVPDDEPREDDLVEDKESTKRRSDLDEAAVSS